MSFDPRLWPSLNQCDPFTPLRLELPEDLETYAPLDELRGHSRRPPGEQLLTMILSADPLMPTAQLLIGPSGAGKSTELWRLKRRLELAPDEVATVLRVDLERWLEPTVPVSVVEVQRVLVDALEQLSGVEQPFFGEWMRRLLRQRPVPPPVRPQLSPRRRRDPQLRPPSPLLRPPRRPLGRRPRCRSWPQMMRVRKQQKPWRSPPGQHASVACARRERR